MLGGLNVEKKSIILVALFVNYEVTVILLILVCVAFARNPDNSPMIMDVRYSLVPNELSPLWVIRLKVEEPWQHVDYLNIRDLTARSRQRFLEMLF